MRLVGVTGGIGAGKSTVAHLFEELGAEVIHVDDLAHEFLSSGTDVHEELVRVFGADILGPDGEIERSKLAEKSFRDEESVEKLNSIVHPRLLKKLRSIIEAARKREDGVLIVDAALLFEWKMEDLFDVTIDVEAEKEVRLRRASERMSSDSESLRRRIRAQLSTEERKSRAGIIIDNDGEKKELRKKINEIWKRWKE